MGYHQSPPHLFLFFSEPYLQHMEVLRLGVESEPHLQPTLKLEATPDPNPLGKARDQTLILVATSWFCFFFFFFFFLFFGRSPGIWRFPC